jgi:ABC-type uncharacterized transport system YnjBCD ATPase subunit
VLTPIGIIFLIRKFGKRRDQLRTKREVQRQSEQSNPIYQLQCNVEMTSVKDKVGPSTVSIPESSNGQREISGASAKFDLDSEANSFQNPAHMDCDGAEDLVPAAAPAPAPGSGSAEESGGIERLAEGERNLQPKEFVMDLRFEQLGLKLKSNGKAVLQGVTGDICHGQVTAVMGPSGAGKTTFLTTLAGKAYYGDVTGRVLVNGQEGGLLPKYKYQCGFVPQDDVMKRMLTVKENLTMAAALRLPQEWTPQQRKNMVNATITMLGLYDIRHSIIGDETTRGISGGQRKVSNNNHTSVFLFSKTLFLSYSIFLVYMFLTSLSASEYWSGNRGGSDGALP